MWKNKKKSNQSGSPKVSQEILKEERKVQSTGESVEKDKVEYLKKEDERLLREDLGKHRESVNIFNQDKKISMDNFDIIKILGRGAFGKVMLVEKKENKKLYALKVMRKDQII